MYDHLNKFECICICFKVETCFAIIIMLTTVLSALRQFRPKFGDGPLKENSLDNILFYFKINQNYEIIS